MGYAALNGHEDIVKMLLQKGIVAKCVDFDVDKIPAQQRQSMSPKELNELWFQKLDANVKELDKLQQEVMQKGPKYQGVANWLAAYTPFLSSDKLKGLSQLDNQMLWAGIEFLESNGNFFITSMKANCDFIIDSTGFNAV